MKYAPYSFSRLNLYSQCARKFKYRVIDKVPQEQGDMTALLKGGAVHHMLEYYPNKSSHKLAPKYQSIVDVFGKTIIGEKYLSKDSTREFSFGLDLKLNPCSYSNKLALFRGSIDYICIVNNTLHLIDWKTGKEKEQKWQDYSQLMYYAIYFFQAYPTIDSIKVSYVYVEHENMENELLLERKYLQKYVNDLVLLIKRAEGDEVFDKTESPLCDWCPYQNHCRINK